MINPKETFVSSAAAEWRPSTTSIRRPTTSTPRASTAGCVFLVTLPKPVVILKDA